MLYVICFIYSYLHTKGISGIVIRSLIMQYDMNSPQLKYFLHKQVTQQNTDILINKSELQSFYIQN